MSTQTCRVVDASGRDGRDLSSTQASRLMRPALAAHDDLLVAVRRDRPNTSWINDITQHSTRDGTVYCCAALAVYSWTIVGRSTPDRMRAELVVGALQTAC
jgi:putative transposase